MSSRPIVKTADAIRQDLILGAIADAVLGLPTLEAQRSGADFKEQAVWCVAAALRAAYAAGKAGATVDSIVDATRNDVGSWVQADLRNALAKI